MIDILRKRRSVRKFQKRFVEPDVIELLKEAALRSPSSRGKNPWRFIFITDNSKIEVLSKSKQHGSSFLGSAPLAIVVAGDPSVSDVWVEDCSIASIIIQLEAESLSMASCWVQIRNRVTKNGDSSSEFIKKELNLDSSLEIESIIAIGFPAECKEPHGKGYLEFDKIVEY